MMLLATDLDGTFLGGSPEDREQLYGFLHAQTDITLVFVTGRGLASVQPLLDDPQIPRPDYIISDVGATIVSGSTLQPLQPLQDEIARKWPGHETVRSRMEAELKGLRYQDVPQERRCSFYYDVTTDIEAAGQVVAELGCDLVQSAGKYLDVLPRGVNKGSTLLQLVQLIAYPSDRILVAGDTMNDRSLYDTGFKGVVVGGAEEALLQYTRSHPRVWQAAKQGAGGIMEVLSNGYISL